MRLHLSYCLMQIFILQGSSIWGTLDRRCVCVKNLLDHKANATLTMMTHIGKDEIHTNSYPYYYDFHLHDIYTKS